jgi:hypothetical protein
MPLLSKYNAVEKTEIPVVLQLWLFDKRIALQMLVEEDIRKYVLHRTVW